MLAINNYDCFQQFKLIELLGSNPISKLGLLTSAVDVVEVYYCSVYNILVRHNIALVLHVWITTHSRTHHVIYVIAIESI